MKTAEKLVEVLFAQYETEDEGTYEVLRIPRKDLTTAIKDIIATVREEYEGKNVEDNREHPV